jgi:4-hydroxybenzoate polyprenyltransferase
VTSLSQTLSPKALSSLRLFATDIKLAHSVFAIPFAAAAFFLGQLPWPSLNQIFLLILCMVTARSTAMGMNRYLDRHIDAANPRTRGRKIPSGELSAKAGLGWSIGSAVIFITSAAKLSPLAGYCALPLLIILAFYSFMKRLTVLTHWYLGVCLGLSPIAVSISISGHVEPPVLLLGAAVCLWTAGFDIIYALQDLKFDRSMGLHSIPSKFSPAVSLVISRASFVSMILLLALAGYLSQRGFLYFFGVAAVATLLSYEQYLVSDARTTGNSVNLNVAFFNMNAYVSVIFLAFTVLDAWLSK